MINLVRATKRRRYMAKQLDRLSVNHEFMTAFDGRSIDLEDNPLINLRAIERSGKVAPASIPGSVGCTLSHLAVWRRAIDRCLEAVVVLEDDVKLPQDLALLARSVAEQMSGAEIALLDFHTSARVVKAVGTPCELPGDRRLFTAGHVDMRGAAAYVATAEACKRLAEAVLPVRSSTDDWVAYRARGAIDRLRFVMPMPVHQMPTFRSTIDTFAPRSLQTLVREAGAAVPGVSHLLSHRRWRRFEHNGWTGNVIVELDTDSSRG